MLIYLLRCLDLTPGQNFCVHQDVECLNVFSLYVGKALDMLLSGCGLPVLLKHWVMVADCLGPKFYWNHRSLQPHKLSETSCSALVEKEKKVGQVPRAHIL